MHKIPIFLDLSVSFTARNSLPPGIASEGVSGSCCSTSEGGTDSSLLLLLLLLLCCGLGCGCCWSFSFFFLTYRVSFTIFICMLQYGYRSPMGICMVGPYYLLTIVQGYIYYIYKSSTMLVKICIYNLQCSCYLLDKLTTLVKI